MLEAQPAAYCGGFEVEGGDSKRGIAGISTESRSMLPNAVKLLRGEASGSQPHDTPTKVMFGLLERWYFGS